MKAYMRTLIFAVILFSAPLLVHADTRVELLARIDELRETVRSLTAQLRAQLAESSREVSFDRNLIIGSRGADVERLQLFLSLYTQFYPEGFVTGYYGELTSAAVSRLKREYGIEEFGFGQETRGALNELISQPPTLVVPISNLTDSESSEGEGEIDELEIDVDVLTRGIHDGINLVRAENNLAALSWDESLSAIALAHAKDQARDNQELTDPNLLCQYPTIRHEGFVGGYLVRDRALSAGISFKSIGENIAMIPAIETRSYSFAMNSEAPRCPDRTTFIIGKTTDEVAYRNSLNSLLERARAIETVTFIRKEYYNTNNIIELAIQGWMDSPGHRENILYPDYTHGGVGVVKVNEYYIITHDLIGR